jgi:predicted methyltransferase
MCSILPPILAQAREWIKLALGPGGMAVDATIGNGHDTAFLAERVGPAGRVVGFDVQASALAETARRLRQAGLEARVELVRRGHEEMAAWFAEFAPLVRPRAVMFNLGYQPGADRSMITRPETTVAALGAALDRIAPGGMITVVVYPGHEGGQAEAEAVLAWARTVPSHRASVATYQFLNPSRPAPFLVAIAPG